MTGRRLLNPGGSSNGLREDVLEVLGVLKVATAGQIQRLTRPHLSFRHTDLKEEAQRKEARTKPHRAAAGDLRRHGLVVDAGRTRGGEKLFSLTPAGLEAATALLGRLEAEAGSVARGAGSTGASHALAVNEAVIALIRPVPDLTLLQDEPPEIKAAAAAVRPGVGLLASYATEVPLPASGTWSRPGPGGARADAVLVAPEDDVPLLFIEVDNCFMDAARIATKFVKYARFLARTVKDVDGKERPLWRTRWEFPPPRYYREVDHPPVLLVFNPLGPRDPHTSMTATARHSRRHWEGHWHGEFHDYDGKIPIVGTTMERLRAHGHDGPAFWRFGRKDWQPLLDAIGNPRRDAAEARRRAEDERRRQKEAAQRAERERREEAQRQARKEAERRARVERERRERAQAEQEAAVAAEAAARPRGAAWAAGEPRPVRGLTSRSEPGRGGRAHGILGRESAHRRAGGLPNSRR
ncbi:hypothetical protein D7231_34625, partial [Streptomyces klenkii]